MSPFRFIPGFLLRAFIRAASRNVSMAGRYGVVAVTAVGMFGKGPVWFIPLSAATVLVTVGGIVERPAVREDCLEAREHLCLTVSFDHELVDGAPAARFISRLAGLIASGEGLRDAVAPAAAEQGPQNDGP